ncbi:MAG: AAA family ATPase [DPANN group archaeon]|nr:AAA family ATPase [DPANN group archaeon]
MKSIITCGPSTGKTTLVNGLSSRGYQVIPESARTEVKNGNNCD